MVKPVAMIKLELINTLEPIKIQAFTNSYTKTKIVLIVLCLTIFQF